MKTFEKYQKAIEDIHIGSLPSDQCFVCSTLKSTQLMTRLRHGTKSDLGISGCEEPIDVLYACFYSKKYRAAINLVIIYCAPKQQIKELLENTTTEPPYSMTFTDFKKSKIGTWLILDEKRGRGKVQLDDQRYINLWDQPVVLKAETDYDKDYRKEWRNGELVYEGNNFGDTSDFYIIGSRKNKV